MPSRHILVIFGTRPEFIKLAPVILALKQRTDLKTTVCNAGQHDELLDSVREAFPIEADIELALMQRDDTLWGYLGRAMERLGSVVAELRPDYVICHGDTSTALAAAWAAHLNRIPCIHVEAGLRTGDLTTPFPEETNRIAIAKLTTHHFAPTERARQNLLSESIDPKTITVTGNTVVDALTMLQPYLPQRSIATDLKRAVLVTIHRRENFGEPAEAICQAIKDLATKYGDLHFIVPVHPNPGISKTIRQILDKHPRIQLTPPLRYVELLALLRDCFLIVTDSGGLQEEAPSFGKPVLVLRSITERPEAAEAGLARIVGASHERIVAAVEELVNDTKAYAKMCAKESPFGDGKAATRIADYF